MAVAVEARRGPGDMGTTCTVGVVAVVMAVVVVVVVEGLGEVLMMFTPSGWPWRR